MFKKFGPAECGALPKINFRAIKMEILVEDCYREILIEFLLS